MVQFRIGFVVPLDHQPKPHARLCQCTLQFAGCFLISGVIPVLGLIAALAFRIERDELRKQCPTCGKVTKIYDALCTRCGAELEFPEVAIAPESWVQAPAEPSRN